MNEDPRKIGLKDGLRQLTLKQLYKVNNYQKEMVLDTYNYEDGKFCPLAVALELDKTMTDPSHDKVFTELTNMGYKVYNTRDIEGQFYTTNRKEDLRLAIHEVMREKIQESIEQGICPCLAIRDRCGVCDQGYHIFCNWIPHGELQEAHDYFVSHPDVARSVIPRDGVGKEVLAGALEEIEKKGL